MRTLELQTLRSLVISAVCLAFSPVVAAHEGSKKGLIPVAPTSHVTISNTTAASDSSSITSIEDLVCSSDVSSPDSNVSLDDAPEDTLNIKPSRASYWKRKAFLGVAEMTVLLVAGVCYRLLSSSQSTPPSAPASAPVQPDITQQIYSNFHYGY